MVNKMTKENKIEQTMITDETLEQLRDAFKKTSVKRIYTTSEAIKTLRADILRMRKEGMPLSQISAILREHGVKASGTLISRLCPIVKQTDNNKKQEGNKASTKKKETATKQNKNETTLAPKKATDITIDPDAADNI